MEISCVNDFIQAFNHADIKRISDLMVGDFIFTDSHGNKVFGKRNMQEAWIGYFTMFPDYCIELRKQ